MYRGIQLLARRSFRVSSKDVAGQTSVGIRLGKRNAIAPIAAVCDKRQRVYLNRATGSVEANKKGKGVLSFLQFVRYKEVDGWLEARIWSGLKQKQSACG